MNIVNKTITLADGRSITIETGKLAKQADGSVEVRMGNTVLLATVVSGKDAREGVDFLPMSTIATINTKDVTPLNGCNLEMR